MAYFFSTKKKYSRKSKNQYIEYEDGLCNIVCTCGDHGTILDIEMLDLLSIDTEARQFMCCPVCRKPLLQDLAIIDGFQSRQVIDEF